jgi:hypothetical protein
MSMQDYAAAHAYLWCLLGADPDVTPVSFRVIHDTDKTVPAHSYDGTLPQLWPTLLGYQAAGYGVFVNINVLDGQGRELQNVAAIRAHPVDLDNLSARQNYDRAAASLPSPAMGVQSSPGKFHVYWTVAPYRDNERYTLVQRKLRQLYDGDKAVIDPTRVLRLPGTLNLKRSTPGGQYYDGSSPHLVTVWPLAGYGVRHDVATLEASLAAVNVIDGGIGTRHDLGDPALAAPSWEWCVRALELADPNNMDRGEWIAFMSAWKQAAWSLATPDVVEAAFYNWCARYEKNDPGENTKQFTSIRNTELGWRSLVARVPSLKALVTLDGKDKTGLVPGAAAAVPAMPSGDGATPPTPVPSQPGALDCSGEFLTHLEQQEWFKGCVAIERQGEIMTPSGRFMGPGQFNMRYGGKQFIISSAGKATDEAWKAALRSTLWTIPKVDHIRFLPDHPQGEIVVDQLGRRGVNTYIPVQMQHKPGDVTPFTHLVEQMLPVESDRNILYAYLAHNVKFPGYKIRWAPMIQSAEGAGKGILMRAMQMIIGDMYCYSPKAQELVKSGSTFNGWMRAKLLIVVNEIKVDERRELIEILKPMISDDRVEVQSKGIDQEMEDNPANWIFFSNFKDAIPISQNGRRYAIFYSALQSAADLLARGMDDVYFGRLVAWLKADGAAIIADWLMRHPITVDTMPGRAPDTSCMAEARLISRGPLERMVAEAVEDGIAGFRGGWISSLAVLRRIKETGAVGRTVSMQTVTTVLEAMGYQACGRAPRMWPAESMEIKAQLYHWAQVAPVADYGRAQGYEG